MNKIDFKNLPDTTTPLSAENLNLLQDNVEDAIKEPGDIVVDNIKSKNLFNKATCVVGYMDNTGNIGVADQYRVSNYIAVKPNKKYTYQGTVIQPSYGSKIALYNASKQWVGYLDIYNTATTITIPNNVYYFRTTLRQAELDTYQFEEGEEATAYTPYQNLTGEDNYSIDEIQIGTWIDGKPLYKKVINFTTASSSVTSWTTCATITNMNRPINIFGFLEYGASTSSIIPTFESSTQRLQFSFSGGNIQYQQQGYNSKNCYAVVIYTKTTD